MVVDAGASAPSALERGLRKVGLGSGRYEVWRCVFKPRIAVREKPEALSQIVATLQKDQYFIAESVKAKGGTWLVFGQPELWGCRCNYRTAFVCIEGKSVGHPNLGTLVAPDALDERPQRAGVLPGVEPSPGEGGAADVERDGDDEGGAGHRAPDLRRVGHRRLGPHERALEPHADGFRERRRVPQSVALERVLLVVARTEERARRDRLRRETSRPTTGGAAGAESRGSGIAREAAPARDARPSRSEDGGVRDRRGEERHPAP